MGYSPYLLKLAKNAKTPEDKVHAFSQDWPKKRPIHVQKCVQFKGYSLCSLVKLGQNV